MHFFSVAYFPLTQTILHPSNDKLRFQKRYPFRLLDNQGRKEFRF